jgi:hypothetical protein
MRAETGRFLRTTHPGELRRRLQRDGIRFERIRYWADVLPALAQPGEPLLIRYDP